MIMKIQYALKISLIALVAAILSSCASTGSDSGPHYFPASNGKGGIVLAPQWR